VLKKVNIWPGRQKFIICIVLAVVTLAVYRQTYQFDFLKFDDEVYVTENSYIQSGITLDGLRWAFSTLYAEFWHPVTWLSLMFDYQIYGLNAGGYHQTNLILHVLSALLVFLLFNRMTGTLWRSAFVAALFALHPLRVESVAWIAERKDVLSVFFGIASLYAYALYTESLKLSRYALCFILFALSLMSKPTMVTLPFVLMLLDVWPLQRWQKAIQARGNSFVVVKGILGEKIPFIILSIIFSILTLWAQQKGHMIVSLENLPFSVRFQNAVMSYVAYLGKMFWPVNLASFYPYEHYFSMPKILAACLMLMIITIAVIYFRQRWSFLFVGWFWYLGTLIPVIGLVKSADYAMADRFTYVPFIGIAMMLVWGMPLLFPRQDMRKKILFPAGIGVLGIFVMLSWQQCGYWKNSIKLWSHALQATENNAKAHNNLGRALRAEGKIKEAIDHYDHAVRIAPDKAMVYFNRALAYASLGQHQRSIEDFNLAVDLNPNFTAAYNNRGMVYLLQGKKSLGCRDFLKACERGDCQYLENAKRRGICY